MFSKCRYNGEKLLPGTEIPKTSVIDLIVGDGTQNRVQNEGKENNEGGDDSEEGGET